MYTGIDYFWIEGDILNHINIVCIYAPPLQFLITLNNVGAR